MISSIVSIVGKVETRLTVKGETLSLGVDTFICVAKVFHITYKNYTINQRALGLNLKA